MRLFAAIGLSATLALPALAEERWETLPMPPAMPTPVAAGTASVNGIEMYYATYGAGDPVLLIHGGLGNADIWANQVIDLMKDHLVIVADSRGHGRSTRTAEPFGYDLMASDYLALLDYLKVDQVDLVGWSDGGIIGLDIAMHQPQRLKHLFAQAANITTDGVNPDVMKDKVFAEYIDWMGKDYARLSPTPDQYDAFVTQISAMWASQPNWTDDEVAAIKVPTVIAAGDHDQAILRAHTEKIARLIPGAKLVILKDTSHFAMLQAPEDYTEAVRELIDE
ncbi:alpha/beta fold hydrolase [bacterium]|nr:alpha/beta fold hydrolase [bacterium]